MTHSIRNRVRRSATTWVPTCGDRMALINHILAEFSMDAVTRRVIAHSFGANGRVLWAVEEYQLPGKPLRRWLSCFSLRRSRSTRVTPAWGFRVTTEQRGPWHHDCPLLFLDLAQETNARWRGQVRRWHAVAAAA